MLDLIESILLIALSELLSDEDAQKIAKLCPETLTPQSLAD